MIPGHRVVFTVFAAGITGFINGDEDMEVCSNPFEIIQFVGALPCFWQVRRRPVAIVDDVERSFLWPPWMIFKISAV
jgi:hypothetical protein